MRLVAGDDAGMSADCCLSCCDDRAAAADVKARVDLNCYYCWCSSEVCSHRLEGLVEHWREDGVSAFHRKSWMANQI